jgi:feruloyl esterase
VRPEVNFEAWLPANWNKKFLMVGNGGLAGTISYAAMAVPLNSGYATASTDTGHVADTDGHWALGHMERVIDFAHRGVHVTAQASKAIIRAFYGAPPIHSYFNGCSQGGQEALTESQRYPLDFDGIIAGDPANNWTRLSIGGHLWITQALLEEPASYIPASKTKAIGDAVNTACDALDGIKDGILYNPRGCHFDPSVLFGHRPESKSSPGFFRAGKPARAAGLPGSRERTRSGSALTPLSDPLSGATSSSRIRIGTSDRSGLIERRTRTATSTSWTQNSGRSSTT